MSQALYQLPRPSGIRDLTYLGRQIEPTDWTHSLGEVVAPKTNLPAYGQPHFRKSRPILLYLRSVLLSPCQMHRKDPRGEFTSAQEILEEIGSVHSRDTPKR